MIKIVGKPNVSIYVLLARDAHIGAVFRRGPSNHVLLLLWHTETDQFFEGQWFKGRIYERRCDLSPSGKRLIYFAANYKAPYTTWTAVSRPPYLTAITLWPKGDAWGGGGLFAKEKKILLNHRTEETKIRSDEMKMAEGFQLPKSVIVKPFGEHSGWGEDSQVLDHRMIRDRWKLIQQGKTKQNKWGAPVWITVEPPQIWAKPHPKNSNPYELRENTKGIKEKNGSWYVIEHSVFNTQSDENISLGRTDWADWCHSGDLLYAKEGKIWRLSFDQEELQPLERTKMLIDLRDRVFIPKEAPECAKTWDGEFELSNK